MKQLLRWDEKMAVGDPLLDAQHMRLITIFNVLSQDIRLGADREVKLRTLAKLADYSLMHFAAEERMMQEVGYDGLEGHRVEHAAFKQAVVGFYQRIAAADPVAGAELRAYLHNWIYSHILTVDVQYGRRLREYLAGGNGADEA